MHSIKIPSFKPLNEDYFNELPRLQPAADSLVLDRFLEIKENLKSVIAVTIQSISFQETGLKDKVLDFINSFKHLELLLFLSCDLFNEDIAAIGKKLPKSLTTISFYLEQNLDFKTLAPAIIRLLEEHPTLSLIIHSHTYESHEENEEQKQLCDEVKKEIRKSLKAQNSKLEDNQLSFE